MKAIKENWKLVLIVAAGIIAVIFMCIFGVQGAQNKGKATSSCRIKSGEELSEEALRVSRGN